MRRWERGLIGALLLGVPVAVWAGAAFDNPTGGSGIGFYGTLWGGLAGTVGAALGAGGRAGRGLLGAATTLLAIGTWVWLAMWRVPPLTLEGAWLWPLATGATAISWWTWRSRRRRTETGADARID